MARLSKTFEARPAPKKRKGIHKKSRSKTEKRQQGKKNRGQGR
jgi:hypothetical protein